MPLWISCLDFSRGNRKKNCMKNNHAERKNPWNFDVCYFHCSIYHEMGLCLSSRSLSISISIYFIFHCSLARMWESSVFCMQCTHTLYIHIHRHILLNIGSSVCVRFVYYLRHSIESWEIFSFDLIWNRRLSTQTALCQKFWLTKNTGESIKSRERKWA